MATILIVEDEEQVLVLTESYLREQGHQTVSAATWNAKASLPDHDFGEASAPGTLVRRRTRAASRRHHHCRDHPYWQTRSMTCSKVRWHHARSSYAGSRMDSAMEG
jgi:hypothetical protein